MDDDLDAVLTAVGPRLRELRRKRDITLADLSSETGVSVSTLSRLESGQRKPTLELLLPLARAHGVQIDDLIGSPVTGDPRVHLKPIEHNGMTQIPLTRHAGGVQAYKLIMPPILHLTPADQKTHEGWEWLYVLNGRLRLLLGDRDILMAPGEAAEFDTRSPHAFGSADPHEPVELLSLFGRQGERAHLRARTTPTPPSPS